MRNNYLNKDKSIIRYWTKSSQNYHQKRWRTRTFRVRSKNMERIQCESRLKMLQWWIHKNLQPSISSNQPLFEGNCFFFAIKWPYDFDPRFLFGQRSPFCKQFCKHSCLFVHIRYFILILLEWMKHRPNYVSIISDLLVILNIYQYYRHIHTHTWLNNDDHTLMVVLRWIFPASLS